MRRRFFYKTSNTSSIPNNEIWYTNGSTTEATIPFTEAAFGQSVVSNLYNTDKECWVIKFNYKLQVLGDAAFYRCSSLTSITIPDSVTTLGDNPFEGCSKLTEFNGKFASADKRCLIVDGVLNSFAPAGLTEYTIPDSVTKIRKYAFYGCTSLTEVTISDSVTEIGGDAFYNCSSITSVTIGNSVATIGSSAFSNCSSLTSITIPNSVTKIENSAFNICSRLTSVIIGNGVTEIGSFAFYKCSSLTSVTIGNGVTEIGNSTFKDCTSLASISIPDSVTTIGGSAFYNCSILTSVTIGNSVTTIGKYAFEDCSSLTSVTIPDRVTEIGKYAFLRCRNLASVYCKSTTPPILGGEGVFNDNAINRRIYVSYQSLDNYKTAEFWSDYANDIIGYDFETDNINKYTITMGVSGSTKAFDYLYNKYGICGSTYSPIEIDEEVYLENFPDYTKLNGKVTRLYVINETGMWLYNEDSMTVYYAATLTKQNNGELTAGTVFYD